MPRTPATWLTQSKSTPGGSLAGCDDFVGEQLVARHQVSGLIAALTNNGIGMASVGRGVRVLPVRVVGKCGGLDSESSPACAGPRGSCVPGVPTNQTPARVINLSLGGSGGC